MESDNNGGEWSRKQRYLLILGGVCLVLLLPMIVSAISGMWTATEDVTFNATDGPEVHLNDGTDIETNQPFPDSNTVDLSPSGIFESNGPTHVAIDDFGTDGTTELSEIETNDETLTVDIDEKNTIGIGGDVTAVEYEDVELDSGNVVTVESEGTVEFDAHIRGDEVAMIAFDDEGTGQVLDQTKVENGVASFELEQEGTVAFGFARVGTAEIIDDTADPVGPVSAAPNQLVVNVSDGFSDDIGAELDVEFHHNGDYVGSDTVTNNGQASTDLASSDVKRGANEWRVVVTDSDGNSIESTYEYSTPTEIDVRDVETLEKIDDREVTVSVYRPDGDEVTTISTEDGTLDLEEVPSGVELVFTPEADDYVTRSVIYESSGIERDLYLLPDSEDIDRVLTEFELLDQTGNFAPGETKILIQRAVEENEGSRTFTTVAGDYFSSDQRFPVELAQGERYRIAVENKDGDRRSLGSYTAESAGVKELELGSIEWPAPDDATYATDVNLIEEDESTFIEFMYTDPEERTRDMTVRIENRYDSEEVIYQETVHDPNNYRLMLELTDDEIGQQWAVNYTATRNPTVEGRIPIGGDSTISLPMSQTWVETFSMVGLVVLAAAFPGALARIGGAVVVAMAGVAILAGWLAIPVLAWFVAATIATLGLVRDAEGGIT